MDARAANKFLESYGNFREAATAEDLVEIGSVLTSVTDTMCEALEGADTIGGTTMQLAAAGAFKLIFYCPP